MPPAGYYNPAGRSPTHHDGAEMTYFPKQLGIQVWYQLLLDWYQRSFRDSLGTGPCIVAHYVTGGS